jgi:amino acid adenylation domain-containing protein
MRNDIADIYELSPMQLGILLDCVHAPRSKSYHQQLVFTLSGNLDINLWKQAWEQLVETYAVFRTSFQWEDLDKPLQIVHSRVLLDWTYKNIEDDKNVDKIIQEEIDTDSSKVFALNRPSLMRCTLIKQNSDHYFFMFSYHHLLLDGWSLAIVIRKVFDLYISLQTHILKDSSLPLPFREYISMIHRKSAVEAQQFWAKELEGFYAPLLFQSATRRNTLTSRNYDSAEITLSPQLSNDIVLQSQALNITPYIMVQGVWGLLLTKYFNTNDVVFGTVVSGRSHQTEDLNNVVGVTMNTIPIRVIVDQDETSESWLKKLFDKQARRDNFTYISLSDIRRQGEVPSNIPLFESILVYENYPISQLKTPITGIKVKNTRLLEYPNIPLAIIVIPGEKFQVKIVYDQNCVTEKFVNEVLLRFRSILAEITAYPTKKLSELRWMNEGGGIVYQPLVNTENPGILTGLNMTSAFSDQVAKNGQATAITSRDRSISFEELDNWSSAIADELRALGISCNERVAILMNNSCELIASILALLKIGACYIPVDPEYPESRISYIISDSQVKFALSRHQFSHLLNGMNVSMYNVEHDEKQKGQSSAKTLAHGQRDRGQLAYIIYTSGSTGKPKGTGITHTNLLNYITWAINYYLDCEHLSFPLFTSFSFDLTVTSIFVPLLSGGKIVIYDDSDKHLALERIITDNAVDIVKLTPSHLQLLRELDCSRSRIKKLIVGGENLERKLADDIIDCFDGKVTIYNEYGPTETTVGCMYYRYEGKGVLGDSIPIGLPIANTSIYLLDEHLNCVPYGAIGELCVSGEGVSSGYLNNSLLTDEKFVANPFAPGTILYKTGDLVKFGVDDALIYIGRKDEQIKHRGLRIDLQEIETILNKHPNIRTSAVVTARFKREETPVNEIYYCISCGLPSNYPNVSFSQDGRCSICQDFERYADKVNTYFGSLTDLDKVFSRSKLDNRKQYDCLMLYSGGKDSTYALCKLVKDFNLRVLVFSFDNGYISDQAKLNIKHVCNELQVELILQTADGMREIFKESLEKFSNVCQGCFKTIYTLGIKIAYQKGIDHIVTGLSRGQLFETRLHELYRANIFEPAAIDKYVLKARKEYHSLEDKVFHNLKTGIFKNTNVLEKIEFIDFYRYSDVKLDDMYRYIKEHVSWVRPNDTGRSTNCMINNVGIFVHKKEKGYHNYALPYSWDVRLGHKTREEALAELTDDINAATVQDIVSHLGYRMKDSVSNNSLIAYCSSENEISPAELRRFLANELPLQLVPDLFIHMPELPLTLNGKVDKRKLSQHKPFLDKTNYFAPVKTLEKEIADIWSNVLGIPNPGIYDNIFDIGGHSMSLTIIFNRLKKKLGIDFSITALYEHTTIASLSNFFEDMTNSSEPMEDQSPNAEKRIANLSSDRRESRKQTHF